jgi:hypothetical protein
VQTEGNATVTPETVAAVVAVLAPTIATSANATVTPAVVEAVVTIYTPLRIGDPLEFRDITATAVLVRVRTATLSARRWKATTTP